MLVASVGITAIYVEVLIFCHLPVPLRVAHICQLISLLNCRAYF